MNNPSRTSIEAHRPLLESLLAQLDGVAPIRREVGSIPAAHYLSREHFAREQAAVFARFPQIVAVEGELAEPGTQMAIEIGGRSLLMVRGGDGVVRAFKNACRHRSTRLLEHGPAFTAKAIVCPYHGWTYDLAGRLLKAPHVESFQGCEVDRASLVPAFAAVRDGFVWAGLEPFELDQFLAPVSSELALLGVARLHPYQRSERVVAANWKHIIDAFLEGYHIRHLHRDSLYRFFIDTCANAERAGDHLRALVGRRGLLEARDALNSIDELRSVATPSYLIFPNTILIVHPDYLSVAIAMPLAVDQTRFIHIMLISRAPESDRDKEHWRKSFELIDRGVFEAEDLFVVEAMQRGLETGANASQLFGEHEFAALWFHQRLAEYTVRTAQVHEL